jgi:hypothetical protein
MRIEFREQFTLPVEEIFGFFRTPADWVRLYGMFGEVETRGDGWYAVPLQGFPFPLVARVTDSVENRLVHWTFRGFWRGEGEVRFESTPDGTRVDGFEEISVRWLFLPLARHRANPARTAFPRNLAARLEASPRARAAAGLTILGLQQDTLAELPKSQARARARSREALGIGTRLRVR